MYPKYKYGVLRYWRLEASNMWENIILSVFVALGLMVIADRSDASHDTLKLGAFPQMISTSWTSENGLPSGENLSLRVQTGRVCAISANQVRQLEGDHWNTVDIDLSSLQQPMDNSALNIPNGINVREVVKDTSGCLWLATDRGIRAQRGDTWAYVLDRNDGMPYDHVNCLAFAPNGDIWGGTPEGAWRFRGGEWRYFWGKRWIPGNNVSDILITNDGSVWLATDNGIASISERSMAMDQKAAIYEDIIAKRHDRHGFVTSSTLKVTGKPDKGVMLSSDDNDGLWTGMYVAAEAFRYAATKSSEAKKKSRRGMNAILDLVRLSGYPGFPARSIILSGENPLGCDLNETVRIKGETDKIWYKSPTHPDVLCKGDTSSDELNGHYFAWYVYFDLVATKAEKSEIRKVVSAVTDNLLRNNYTLVGHTGRKTRWGVFDPKSLNDDPTWREEKALNSISMLCFLKVAYHICGNESYKSAYEDLINNHHYLLNAFEYPIKVPWYEINHSDHELAFLGYYPLMMLEKDPARHAILVHAFSRLWQSIRPERSSLYNFIYGATTDQPCDVEYAAANLKDWPLDLVRYDTKNSQRHDVNLKFPDLIQIRELDRVLPVSERQPWRWNGNPWTPDGGEGGKVEEDGTAWLLPYWMGRYHKFISD